MFEFLALAGEALLEGLAEVGTVAAETAATIGPTIEASQALPQAAAGTGVLGNIGAAAAQAPGQLGTLAVEGAKNLWGAVADVVKETPLAKDIDTFSELAKNGNIKDLVTKGVEDNFGSYNNIGKQLLMKAIERPQLEQQGVSQPQIQQYDAANELNALISRMNF